MHQQINQNLYHNLNTKANQRFSNPITHYQHFLQIIKSSTTKSRHTSKKLGLK